MQPWLDNRSCRSQVSGLCGYGSMRSHTDMSGNSRDPGLRGAAALSIQVISSQKSLYHSSHRWVAASATLPVGFSNRLCELTHALSHLKHSLHSHAGNWLCAGSPWLLLSLFWIPVLIEAIDMEGAEQFLPSKLPLCQPEAIKSRSLPTLFS